MHGIHRSILPAAMAGASLLAAPAVAQQAEGAFTVSATVGSACTLSVSDLAFGAYTGVTAVSGLTSVTLDCSAAVDGTLTLTGSSGQGTDGFAMLASRGSLLDYDLFQDSGLSQQIISGQGFATSAMSGVTPVRIFGQIPAGQNAADGVYTDRVNVVFNF